MALSIPYNGDLELLRKLIEADKYSIKTVYGKRYQDVIGGGRARYDVADYAEDNLKEAINLTHKLGAEFNYLFNAPCSANAEKENADLIIYEVRKLLEDYPVDMITVANPFVLKLLKENFPKMKYSVSVISKVDCLEKINEYIQLGANEITLDYNIYRNFPKLKQIIEETNIGYQLIVNDGYLFNCPWAGYHFTLEGHDSQAQHNSALKYFSYCRFNCKQQIARNNMELIRGMWIRPEDIHYYEEIGFNKFKIIDRLKDTEWLINAIDAYHNKKYAGNLSDILCSFDTFNKEEKHTRKIKREDITLDNIQNLKDYWDLKPFVDNDKLTELNFLDYFVNKKFDCNNVKCENCRYCEKIADEVVNINEENAANVDYNLSLLKDTLVDLLRNNGKD